MDELPEASVEAACVMLRLAREPLVAGLEAAVHEDPPFVREDEAGTDEGWAAYGRGEAFTVGDLRVASGSDALRRGPRG